MNDTPSGGTQKFSSDPSRIAPGKKHAGMKQAESAWKKIHGKEGSKPRKGPVKTWGDMA
jgi:hypothetical protein